MNILVTISINILLIANSYAADDCTIKVRVNDSPPSYFKDSEGNWNGFVVEQVAAVLREAGCIAEYRSAPWGRGMILLKEGEIDMMGMMSIIEERKAFANFIGPHYFETIRLVVANDSDYKIEKHEDLKNLPGKIMMEPNAYIGEEMERLVKDPAFAKKVQWTPRIALTREMIKKVTLGRVSGFTSYVTPGALKKFTQEVKYHPFVINKSPVYFGISKKSVDTALLEKLGQAVERIKTTGEFEKIVKKYE